MSAIHGIDDIWSMNGPKFFRFAWRLAFYPGAVREWRLREQQEREEASPSPAPQQYEPPGYAAPAGRQPKLGTRALIENDQMFKGLISFG